VTVATSRSTTTRTSTASGESRAPSFLVIGAHRAAQRWLRYNLAEHPDVYLAPRTVRFFTDPNWAGGFRGYRARFRDGRDAVAIGDVDPDILRSNRDLHHIVRSFDDRLPDVRLVAVVREPVDRLWSAFRDHVIHGRLPLTSDLAKMVRTDDLELARLDLIGSGRYARNLYPFWRHFGDRLLVIVADDIRTDPERVYAAVLEHIGVDPGFTPSRLHHVLYSNAHSKWGAESMPDDAQRRVLAMLFREDVEELEAMLGRSLAAWDPGPPPPGWRDRLSARQVAEIGVV
jgi:hypothetical protein